MCDLPIAAANSLMRPHFSFPKDVHMREGSCCVVDPLYKAALAKSLPYFKVTILEIYFIYFILYIFHIFHILLTEGHLCNKGFSRSHHLKGKGCKTGMCRQAWSFPLFDPM